MVQIGLNIVFYCNRTEFAIYNLINKDIQRRYIKMKDDIRDSQKASKNTIHLKDIGKTTEDIEFLFCVSYHQQ